MHIYSYHGNTVATTHTKMTLFEECKTALETDDTKALDSLQLQLALQSNETKLELLSNLMPYIETSLRQGVDESSELLQTLAHDHIKYHNLEFPAKLLRRILWVIQPGKLGVFSHKSTCLTLDIRFNLLQYLPIPSLAKYMQLCPASRLS